jgi:hypothetical protein
MSKTPQFRLKGDKIQLSENDVREACLGLLRAHHWWPIRQHVGLFKTRDGRWINIGENGDPDYAVIKAPSFFLELKRPGGTLSVAQQERIEQLNRFYGLQTLIVDDAEQLVEWLKQHERSP